MSQERYAAWLQAWREQLRSCPQAYAQPIDPARYLQESLAAETMTAAMEQMFSAPKVCSCVPCNRLVETEITGDTPQRCVNCAGRAEEYSRCSHCDPQMNRVLVWSAYYAIDGHAEASIRGDALQSACERLSVDQLEQALRRMRDEKSAA